MAGGDTNLATTLFLRPHAHDQLASRTQDASEFGDRPTPAPPAGEMVNYADRHDRIEAVVSVRQTEVVTHADLGTPARCDVHQVAAPV